MTNPNDDVKRVAGPLGSGQRWTVARKREVVLRMLRGDALDALSRELAVEVSRLERWRDKALDAMDEGLRERGGDPRDEQLDALRSKLGEALMENELLRLRAGRIGPFGIKRLKR